MLAFSRDPDARRTDRRASIAWFFPPITLMLPLLFSTALDRRQEASTTAPQQPPLFNARPLFCAATTGRPTPKVTILP
jgi:hypothetical protein